MTFTNILFPVDFSDRSRAAAPFVLSLARRYKSRVILIHALEPPPPVYGGMNTIYPEAYDFTGLQSDLQIKLAEFAGAELPKADSSCIVEMGSPSTVIMRSAESHGIDLIAMPTHGYGPFRRALLGSVTAKVLHDAKMPVWTDAHAPEASHRAHPQPRHIIAALDLKPQSLHTLEVALQLGREAGAVVEIVHAAFEGEIATPESETRLSELLAQAAREQLLKVQQQARSNVDVMIVNGTVATLVRAAAIRRRSDLIVIGRGSIQGAISRLRANAYAIIREAPCPVLSV